MKRKSVRQAEKRAAREMATLQSEESTIKYAQPIIKNPDPSSAPEVKPAFTPVTMAEEASAGETSAPRKSRMRRAREFMEEERRAAEQLLIEMNQKEHEVLREKEKTADMQRQMDMLLGTAKWLKQELAEEKARSGLKTRWLHKGMDMLRERSADLERQLAETKIQAATFSDENERLQESLGEERQRVVSLQGRLTVAETKTLSATETCSHLQDLLEQTQVSMVAMASDHLTAKQNQQKVETKMMLEMKEALNGQIQAETALVQVQASLVDVVKQNTREKQVLLERLSEEEDKSRLTLQACSQAEEALAVTQTSMVAMEAMVESFQGRLTVAETKTLSATETCSRLQDLLEQTQVSVVAMASDHLTAKQNQQKVETKMMLEMKEALNGQIQAETALVQVQASLVDVVKQNTREKQVLLERLSEEEDKSRLTLQACSQAEEALAVTQTSMGVMEAQVESLQGRLTDLMKNREEEQNILVEEKIQALAAQGRAEKALSQAQVSLREMENLDLQMRELEEEKQQAQTDLQLALSQIQAVRDGFLGRLLFKKAKKRMERTKQKEG